MTTITPSESQSATAKPPTADPNKTSSKSHSTNTKPPTADPTKTPSESQPATAKPPTAEPSSSPQNIESPKSTQSTENTTPTVDIKVIRCDEDWEFQCSKPSMVWFSLILKEVS